MKRLIITLLSVVAVLALAWLAGFNFNHCGLDTAVVVGMGVFVAFAAITCPLIED